MTTKDDLSAPSVPAVTPPSPIPPDPMSPAVLAILDRAGRLTSAEGEALDRAFRARLAEEPDLLERAAAVIEEHDRWLNEWAMFDHWSHP